MQRVGFSNIIQLIMMTSGSFKTHNIFVTCTNLWTCILLENMCTGLRPGCTQLIDRNNLVAVICWRDFSFLFSRIVGKRSLNAKWQRAVLQVKIKGRRKSENLSYCLRSSKQQERNPASAMLREKLVGCLMGTNAGFFFFFKYHVHTLEVNRNCSSREE